MRIREIIIPASLIGSSWALVAFALFFVLQMLAWWSFPSPWPGSLASACAPHQAVKTAGMCASGVFLLMFYARLLLLVRGALLRK